MLLRILSLLIVASLPLGVAAHDHVCQKLENELQCVLKSYPAIYQESPEYFWKVLNQTREAALSCSSDRVAADFLQLASLANPGADLEEFVSEGIEKLCVTQPACFKRVLGKLNEKNRAAVKKRLANPTYFESSELVGCYRTKSKRKSKVPGSN